MTFLPQSNLGDAFAPYVALRQSLGFLPNLFVAQSLLPRTIEAEARIAGEVLIKTVGLERTLKEFILLGLAARSRNTYCTTAHAYELRALGVDQSRIDWVVRGGRDAAGSAREAALLDFTLKLGERPSAIAWEDVHGLREQGWTDVQILEAVLVTALTKFLCTLSVGLDATPDFEPVIPAPALPRAENRSSSPGLIEKPRPYLAMADLPEDRSPALRFLRSSFGFVPNIFRAQTLRPDVLEAEAQAVRDILLTNDVLARVQKEYILLVISAANWNTYCVAVHCEMLRGLGIPEEESDQIALDHRRSGLSAADKALLNFALKLAVRPADYGPSDVSGLRAHGFSDSQVLEAIVMSALTNLLNTLQVGLGVVPDFPPRREFAPPPAPGVNLSGSGNRLTTEPREPAPTAGSLEDPDASLLARVRDGEVDAFEQLVNRHQGRVYRTLLGIVGNAEDAEDGAQRVFLRAFERLEAFEGNSLFSTWLTRIAIHEGIERLRRRRREESLDSLLDEGPGDGQPSREPFRPRLVQAWDDPESLYARTELREILERELLKLPTPYRMAVILRDLQQLSTAEAAEAMGLPIPTLKTRLSRGRLMLREALAGYFRRPSSGMYDA